MTCEEAQELVKGRLSRKRYKHTVNVKNKAVELARRYGADEEKAALAALLHDSAKELPQEEMLQIFSDNAIMAKNAASRPTPVWHGIAAAILCATQWGVTDPEILSAIECHTTGKADMTLLEKIIYMADATSAERDYPGVDRLRQEEMQDLDLALLHSLQQSIAFVKKKGGKLDPQTVAACEDLQERIAQKG
ncbi:bis(5'-nucleosyl)-tetraphosphatase (symmetrical) YqeK [uncultured Gemmiger sp.]|uniref:bis(5'-nucleosyl)-tetraphosphatase (symmetrical) YqeK n=1 Tax=uncultured Gemmiger sp. TaxID=1623490 RepID=UPI0025D1B32E|nr:bis(5'-nucleosyl)-tetraphosphatase (symmetrical) YqeK [uncultured Gemmiger sp.]